MKRMMFFGAMLLMGTMLFNAAVAQTPEQRRQMDEKRGNHMINVIDTNGGCVDSDDWMTAEGTGASQNQLEGEQIARNRARDAAENELLRKMEAYAKGVSKRLSISKLGECPRANSYNSRLETAFITITEGIRGRIRECYSIPERSNRGVYKCKYVAVVSLEEINKELKDAIERDLELRDNIDMDRFDEITDNIWDNLRIETPEQ